MRNKRRKKREKKIETIKNERKTINLKINKFQIVWNVTKLVDSNILLLLLFERAFDDQKK